MVRLPHIKNRGHRPFRSGGLLIRGAPRRREGSVVPVVETCTQNGPLSQPSYREGFNSRSPESASYGLGSAASSRPPQSKMIPLERR